MGRKSIILAAGGSGGHVFPAQAIAENFVAKNWSVFFISDKRGLEFSKNFPSEAKKCSLGVTNPKSGGILGLLVSILLIFTSLLTVLKLYLQVRPHVVVGFGGYPSVPALIAAIILRIPIAIHEQNAILGRANSLFRNKVFFLAFGIEPPEIPKLWGKTIVTGNPIRHSLLRVNPLNYEALQEGVIKILIIGGSQGATFISKTACDAICALPPKIRAQLEVIHQCRSEENHLISKNYATCHVRATTRTFFYDIQDLMNTSHFVICRAGASTLTELCLFGRPSIIIPLPNSSKDHQFLNAKVMEKMGASVVLDQSDTGPELLLVEIRKFIRDRKLRNKMACAALSMSKRDAGKVFVDQIADEIEGLPG